MRIVVVLFALAMAHGPLSPAFAQSEASIEAEMREALVSIRAQTGLVAMTAGVLVDGEVVAIVADGERIHERGDAVSPDDLWHIGSITKSMTATMMATLHDDGTLPFETPLGDVFGDDVQPDWHDVTVTDLLSHRSGAPANFSMFSMLRGNATTQEERADQRRDLVMTLIGAPRELDAGPSRYSNVGITIAAHMAEVRTGERWEDLMEQRLFRPLGLTGIIGAPTGSDAPWGHADGVFGLVPADPDQPRADNPQFMAPAGGVALPIRDLLTYGALHLGRTDNAIISPDMLSRLQTPPAGAVDEAGETYAYGWIVPGTDMGLGAGEVIWHNGSNTKWVALLLIMPETNTVMAFAANDGRFRMGQSAFFDLAAEYVDLLDRTPQP